MIARIFRISLVIILLFVSWISTGFLKLVQENGISFDRFEEHIARADVGGLGTFGAISFGDAGTGPGPGPGDAGTGPGPGPGDGCSGAPGDAP